MPSVRWLARNIYLVHSAFPVIKESVSETILVDAANLAAHQILANWSIIEYARSMGIDLPDLEDTDNA